MLTNTDAPLYHRRYNPVTRLDEWERKFMSGGFENVGWTRPGQENLYNICIMEELCSILAMGGGASTKLVCSGGRLERHIDPKYPTEYIANIDRICAAKAKLEAFFL